MSEPFPFIFDIEAFTKLLENSIDELAEARSKLTLIEEKIDNCPKKENIYLEQLIEEKVEYEKSYNFALNNIRKSLWGLHDTYRKKRNWDLRKERKTNHNNMLFWFLGAVLVNIVIVLLTINSQNIKLK